MDENDENFLLLEMSSHHALMPRDWSELWAVELRRMPDGTVALSTASGGDHGPSARAPRATGSVEEMNAPTG